MLYTTQTSLPLESIKSQLAERAKAAGFGVLGQYDFKKILESKGFPIERDITVYELCNPSAAQGALTALPEISIYLPCRLSVYEEDGKSVLVTIGIEEMLGNVTADDELRSSMLTIFDNIKGLMDSF